MLYRKSLRITAASKGKMGVGAIVNLQSNDASKLWGMAQYLHIIWSGPFQVRPLPCWSSFSISNIQLLTQSCELPYVIDIVIDPVLVTPARLP